MINKKHIDSNFDSFLEEDLFLGSYCNKKGYCVRIRTKNACK